MAHHGDMDIKAHKSTYGSVMAMLKWGAVVCFLIGMGVVWVIAS